MKHGCSEQGGREGAWQAVVKHGCSEQGGREGAWQAVVKVKRKPTVAKTSTIA